MTASLGTLKKVELRNIWAREDRDFTPWLAREEHLKLLAETIGMELELEAQEKDVGPFSADILCKNIHEDSWVVIENQIERTDHTHLGQLLTYAAGLQAVTVVWIAAKFTDEHRAALDWLNSITDDHFRFFGLEVELWQINDSLPAPKFNIVSKPNNWSKTVSQAAQRISQQATTETQQLQYRYWEKFVKFLQDSNSKLRSQSPRPQHWQIFTIGRSGIDISTTLNTRENRIGVELSLSHPQYSKAFFHLLARDKDRIEQELGTALEWQELPEKTTSRIVLYKNFAPTNEAEWSVQHQWLKETVEAFDRVFRNRVKNLNPDEWIMEEAA